MPERPIPLEEIRRTLYQRKEQDNCVIEAKEGEEILAIFQSHGTIYLAPSKTIEEAQEKIKGWRDNARKNYPNFDWDKVGFVIVGKRIGGEVPSAELPHRD